MINKTICILRSNPVDPDSRVEKEARALEEAGFKVIIFCWDRASDHPVQKSLLNNSEIEVYRAGFRASYGEGMKNIVPFCKFQFCMRRWLLKHKYLYDAIHACDFDTAHFSFGVGKKLKKVFVFDIFDFICGNPKNFFQRIIKRTEIKLINRSSAVIICTEDRRKQIEGSNPQKMVVIHNTPPFLNYPEEDRDTSSGHLNVSYVGILSNNRLLLEEIEVFKRHKDWHFYVAGFGLHEKEFLEASSKFENIHFLGKISYDEALRVESEADIMLAIYDPNIENHFYAAPNKFYEALMLGKPLLMVKNTGLSNIIEINDFGVLIDYSAESFEEGIKNIIERKRDWPVMSHRMKILYKNNYDWDVMKTRLTTMYFELFGLEVDRP